MLSQSGRQKFIESCDRGVVSLLEGCSDCNRLTLTQLLTDKDEQPNYTQHSDTANSSWLLAVAGLRSGRYGLLNSKSATAPFHYQQINRHNP